MDFNLISKSLVQLKKGLGKKPIITLQFTRRKEIKLVIIHAILKYIAIVEINVENDDQLSWKWRSPKSVGQ